MELTASVTAANEIRRRILKGAYRPGMALRTATLATELGVSRTPVRDALLHLQNEGLIIIHPRTGARVRELTIEERKELFLMRSSLEPTIAMLAAHRRLSEDLRRLRQLSRDMNGLLDHMHDEGTQREFRELDYDFHAALATAAHSELAGEVCRRLRLWQSLSDQFAELTVITGEHDFDFALTARGHEALFQAVERKDAIAAREIMEQHLQSIADVALAWLAGKGDAAQADSVSTTGA